jgi:hypothetical protein
LEIARGKQHDDYAGIGETFEEYPFPTAAVGEDSFSARGR